jgi:cytochrome P450
MSEYLTAPAPANASKCPVNHQDIDLLAPGSQEYWFDAYEILHRECPVVHLPGEGRTPGTDAFIVTRYDDIRRIVRDPQRFTTQPNTGNSEIQAAIFREEGFAEAVEAQSNLRPDIEAQKRYRQQITDPWVGPPGAARHRDLVHRIANSLIDRWIDAGEVEFVKGFAAPLPQTVITTILGFPLEDMPMLRKMEEAQVRRFVHSTNVRNEMSPEEERENAADLVEFNRYIQAQIDRKRKQPADDMVTFLTRVEFDGRKLNDGEITSVALLMHIGGNETTQYALTAEAVLLARNPGLVRELRDDESRIRFFVEESLRLYAPTQGLTARIAAEDVEIRGVKVPKGSTMHLRFGAANRDPGQFPDPGAFDMARPHPGQHLTFSQGPRSCPGAGLSRLEQNVATQVLLERLETLDLHPEKNDFLHQPGIMLGMNHLDLTFTKRT